MAERAKQFWTFQDIQIWRTSFLKYGNDWKAIATCVKTKTPSQCQVRRDQYRNKLKKNPNLDPELFKAI